MLYKILVIVTFAYNAGTVQVHELDYNVSKAAAEQALKACEENAKRMEEGQKYRRMQCVPMWQR